MRTNIVHEFGGHSVFADVQFRPAALQSTTKKQGLMMGQDGTAGAHGMGRVIKIWD